MILFLLSHVALRGSIVFLRFQSDLDECTCNCLGIGFKSTHPTHAYAPAPSINVVSGHYVGPFDCRAAVARLP